MGLDQYAYAYKGEPSKDADGCTIYPEKKELAYWRKHPNLHGWMAERWIAANPGMTPDDFNCVAFELNEELLDELQAAVASRSLPATAGFFFGGDSDDHYQSQDLRFIVEARQRLADGYKVVYDSWW